MPTTSPAPTTPAMQTTPLRCRRYQRSRQPVSRQRRRPTRQLRPRRRRRRPGHRPARVLRLATGPAAVTPRRHPTALPSPAADIAGRGHMPHRLPVQPTLPSDHYSTRAIAGVVTPVRYHHPRSRSLFRHTTGTPVALPHSGRTPAVVSPETPSRPLTAPTAAQQVSQTPYHPRFLTPKMAGKRPLLQTLKNRAKSDPKSDCKNL